ncbi:hypothetical protein FKB34_10745 [Glycocaulis profundi]|nr:hypothetical protein FKB34_10745 [Glycocaulis profundi]
MTSALLALIAALAAQPQSGVCDGYPVTATMDSSGVYDPSSVSSEPVRLRLVAGERGLPDECAMAPVVITQSGAGAFPVALEGASGRLDAHARYSDTVTMPGNRLELTLDARRRLIAGEPVLVDMGDLRPGQYAAPGLYSAHVEIAAGTDVSALPVHVQVMPALRFVGSAESGRADMNLGNPATGAQSASTQFMFLTNTAVEFSVRSDNSGALVHEQGRGTGEIAYDAWLNQRPVALASGDASVTMTFSPGSMVRSGELRLSVPQNASLLAGSYRDTITVTMTPF